MLIMKLLIVLTVLFLISWWLGHLVGETVRTTTRPVPDPRCAHCGEPCPDEEDGSLCPLCDILEDTKEAACLECAGVGSIDDSVCMSCNGSGWARNS